MIYILGAVICTVGAVSAHAISFQKLFEGDMKSSVLYLLLTFLNITGAAVYYAQAYAELTIQPLEDKEEGDESVYN
jgi:hypothetical protein